MEEASFVDPLLTSLVQTLLSPLPFQKVSSLPQMTEAGELFLGFESRRGRILEIQRIFEVTTDVQMSTPLLVEIIPYETVTFRTPCWTLESSLKRGLSLVLGMAFTCLEPSVQHARAQITLAPPPYSTTLVLQMHEGFGKGGSWLLRSRPHLGMGKDLNVCCLEICLVLPSFGGSGYWYIPSLFSRMTKAPQMMLQLGGKAMGQIIFLFRRNISVQR